MNPLTLVRSIRRERDTRYIGTLLDGLPLVEGDTIRANLFGTRSQDIAVISAVPRGVVLVHARTKIEVKEKAEAGAKGSKISYEDVGGLGKELHRVREMVENIVHDWKTRYADLVYNILKELSYEAKVNNPVGIKNLLNTSFLIERSQESQFKEQVYELDSRFQGRVNFKYVGPMPPYDFVNLRLDPVKC